MPPKKKTSPRVKRAVSRMKKAGGKYTAADAKQKQEILRKQKKVKAKKKAPAKGRTPMQAAMGSFIDKQVKKRKRKASAATMKRRTKSKRYSSGR